jgi:hypothetical protein
LTRGRRRTEERRTTDEGIHAAPLATSCEPMKSGHLTSGSRASAALLLPSLFSYEHQVHVNQRAGNECTRSVHNTVLISPDADLTHASASGIKR